MKSFGLVAPFLAGSAAARALLDIRDLIGIDASGAVCPAPRLDQVIVQPIFYSEFFPYNTVIDPFRNGKPFTVSNAPTPVVILSDFRTTVLGGSVTVPPTNTVTVSSTSSTSANTSAGTGSTTTSSTASSTITAPATLNLGDGLPRGFLSDGPDAPDFLVLAYTTNFIQPAKRHEVEKRQASAGVTARPIVAVDLIPGDNSNGFAVDLTECDQATPLVLQNGALVNGNNAVGKLQGSEEASVGFLINPGANSVNTTISLRNGLLFWAASDGVGNADFFACPDGLYAGFPFLTVEKAAECTLVRAGAIGGAACSAFVARSRAVNPNFTRPSIPATGAQTATTTSTSTSTASATTTSVSGSMSTSTGFSNTTTSAGSTSSDSSTTATSTSDAGSSSTSSESSSSTASDSSTSATSTGGSSTTSSGSSATTSTDSSTASTGSSTASTGSDSTSTSSTGDASSTTVSTGADSTTTAPTTTAVTTDATTSTVPTTTTAATTSSLLP